PRFIKRHSKKAGTSPGTLIHIGEKKTEETKITLIDFDEAHLQEQIIDTIESYRDILAGMLDIYLSTVSNKMNEVMKVLTIIATIFIPITFVAGIYGMNFKFMPELEWRWGYVMVWAIIVVVAGIMIGFFKKKQWL
ncbi:MAG: hypothetical protein JRD01_13425, partial [Deltaproteobacteria bacterium]|nr:hypothetical protein [Deltaproteobacteria bacterium]